jgi:hypothetical protein
VFAEKASKSIQGIIKAKKQLEDIGLLVVLERGGGSKKGEYMLDLWYDNPDKSIKVSMLQQENLLSEEQEETPDLLGNPTTDEPAISEKLQPEPEESVEEAENQFPAESLDEELPARDTIGKSESNTPEEPVSDPNYPILQSEISDPEVASNPSKMEGFETSTTKLSLPPSTEDNSNNIYNKNKQTKIPEDEEPKEKRKKIAATVCSLLHSQGIKLEPNDYAFIGWCLKHYGVEAVQQKIQIMRFQINRGIEFSNPLGWLRSALTKDYAYSQWDAEVVRGKERARRISEQSRREQMQKERKIQEMEHLREEAETVKAQLTLQDRERLRKRAIDQILAIEGMTKEWINDPLIESVENQILREDIPG